MMEEAGKCKIYIVGEKEGEFSEGCGRVLNKLLMDVGIVRSNCVFNYLCPSGDALVEDIKRVRPNVVCALGNEVFSFLFNRKGVTNWRGSVLWHCRLCTKVIPLIHPSMLIKQWDYLPLSLFDWRRVLEESKTPDYSIPHRDFILAPTFEQTMCELSRIQQSKKRVAFDIETSGLAISAIAFASSPWEVISIPFTFSKGTNTIDYWTMEEEVAVMHKIEEVMEDENIQKIAQNAQFDCTILAINPPYIRVRGLQLDTMCAHHCIYPELPKGLDVLCSIYTRQPYYKHWIHEGDDVTFWKYNGMDACVTYECAIAIEKEMEEFGVTAFYERYVHPLLPILMDMQIRGVKVDEKVREEAKVKLNIESVEMQSALDALVGHNVNVMSPKQLKELLYRDMKLPVKYNRKSGTETVNEEALEELAIKYPSPIFKLVLNIRRNRKLVGTYLTDEGGTDGRIRCSYMVGGTETGRLSSRGSIFGSGTNLQNIPKGVCRRMFIPDEGKVFVEADLSQAEARVVAYLSGEERLIRLFEEGGDIHVQNASWIFNCPIEAVTKEQRELAKKLVHASNYGIGVRAFAHHAGVKEGEARLLLQKYFDTFPSIRQWQLTIQSNLGKSKVMCTPMGRKRVFYGRWGEQLFREAYAYVPQSTVADVLNLAMINYGKIKFPYEDIMLQIHDAFIVQTLMDSIESTTYRIRCAFQIPITIKGKTFTIPIEIKWGKNWDEMEKI